MIERRQAISGFAIWTSVVIRASAFADGPLIVAKNRFKYNPANHGKFFPLDFPRQSTLILHALALCRVNAMNSFSPLTDPASVITILSKISIFGGITDVQRIEVFRRLETGFFKKGDCIFKRGDEPTHIYIVKRGKVDIRITDNEVVLKKHELGVGECFGEASLMSMHRHTATALAAEDSEIIVLSRHALNQLRHEDPALFSLLLINIARELARRLKTTDDILLHYLHGSMQAGV